MKKILWFTTKLIQSGGGERFSLEVIKSLSTMGFDTNYLAYNYNSKAVFLGKYDQLNIDARSTLEPKKNFSNWFTKRSHKWRQRLWLRKQIKELKPDLILTSGTWGQSTELYLATFGMTCTYDVHVFGSLFAFPPSMERTKYARLFSGVFEEIRDSNDSYPNIVPKNPPTMSFLARMSNEISAYIKYLSVVRARNVYVLSEKNRWETEKLYGVSPVVSKAAFPASIFKYKSDRKLKEELALGSASVLLSVCRLSKNKRVDLAIRAFSEALLTLPSLVFLIGGCGSQDSELKALVKSLGIESNVKFLGFINDEDLWDYLQAADAFISLDVADFDIAPLEALALGSKVIWSEEMDLENIVALLPNRLCSVPADYKIIGQSIISMLSQPSEVDKKYLYDSLSHLTWEEYSASIAEDEAAGVL